MLAERTAEALCRAPSRAGGRAAFTAPAPGSGVGCKKGIMEKNSSKGETTA